MKTCIKHLQVHVFVACRTVSLWARLNDSRGASLFIRSCWFWSGLSGFLPRWPSAPFSPLQVTLLTGLEVPKNIKQWELLPPPRACPAYKPSTSRPASAAAFSWSVRRDSSRCPLSQKRHDIFVRRDNSESWLAVNSCGLQNEHVKVPSSHPSSTRTTPVHKTDFMMLSTWNNKTKPTEDVFTVQ